MTRFSLLPQCKLIAQWLLAVALLSAIPSAWADKIYLKDGTVVSGKITTETDDDVRISIITGTIKDTKLYKKIQIERIERTTPEDFAYEVAIKVIPTAPGLTVNEYDQLIKRPQEFLEKYPESSRKDKIEKVIAQLEDERKKVELGFRKFRSEWLSPSEQLSHRVNMEADTALNQMRSVVEGSETGWQLAALRLFERIEKNYQGTLAFPEAVELARQVLPKYGGFLTNEIGYARHEIAKRQKALAGMGNYQKTEYQKVLAQEKERYTRQVEAETKRGLFWTTVNLVDETSLKSGIDRVRKEIERVGKYDLEAIRAQADQLWEVEGLLAEENVEEAKLQLAEALKVKGGAKNTRDNSLKVLAAIQSKIAQVEEKAAKAAALADRNAMEASKIADAVKKDGEAESPEAANGEDKPLSASQAIAEMARQKQAAVEAAKPKKPEPKKSSTSSTAKKTSSTAASTTSPAPSSGGGFNFLFLVPVLLIGVTVGLYFMDKKKKAQAGGGEE
tara:strand:+ start:7801 stop:9312 length:1512 start_codon:yes stop_codon:yes gene_type:complete